MEPLVSAWSTIIDWWETQRSLLWAEVCAKYSSVDKCEFIKESYFQSRSYKTQQAPRLLFLWGESSLTSARWMQSSLKPFTSSTLIKSLRMSSQSRSCSMAGNCWRSVSVSCLFIYQLCNTFFLYFPSPFELLPLQFPCECAVTFLQRPVVFGAIK